MSELFQKTFDFYDYSVKITHNSITYIFCDNKGELTYCTIPSNFDITIDDEKDGGKIEINFTDRFGSKMQFIHYKPSDLKGMFDFIGRGYRLKQIE